jgi:hypothetical protein
MLLNKRVVLNPLLVKVRTKILISFEAASSEFEMYKIGSTYEIAIL